MAEATAVRAREALARLRRAYPPRHAFLRHESPFQLLVAVILSAQTRDDVVNRVTPRLFEAYPTAEAMARAPAERVERLIDGVGFARSKARYLVGTARGVVERFGGEVPRALDDLTSLPGVGRKTASVVQGYVFGEADMVAVDTHVKRVSRRLALAEAEAPDVLAGELGALYPPRDWPDLNYYFIQHGRSTCVARRPLCGGCPVEDLCPKVGVLRPGSDPEGAPHPTRAARRAPRPTRRAKKT